MAAADLNGDGKLDLVVGNKHSICVLFGDGRGTFEPAVIYPTVLSPPTSVTVADLNQDGIPDIVATHKGTYAVSIMLGTGGGTFQAAQDARNFNAGSFPEAALVGDFNLDGIPDLAFVSGGVTILTNQSR